MTLTRHRGTTWLTSRSIVFAAALFLAGSTGLRAQECLPIPLQGLPSLAQPGEVVRLTAALTNDCNMKIVDSATVVCRFDDGEEIRRDALLVPQRGDTEASVEIQVPDVGRPLSGECFIEFTQCNRTDRTCAAAISVPSPSVPGGGVKPPPFPSVPVPRSRPRPRPQTVPSAPSAGPPVHRSDRGTFVRGLGWLGVIAGLAAYADASSKEEEGRTAEADDSSKLGDQLLVASGALLLVGYGMRTTGFVDDEPEPRRRIRPMVAVDPIHRAVLLNVSLSFN